MEGAIQLPLDTNWLPGWEAAPTHYCPRYSSPSPVSQPSLFTFFLLPLQYLEHGVRGAGFFHLCDFRRVTGSPC